MNIPCYGIIPARYASTRFPGKPLADIGGRPMFWHVYNRAQRCTALYSVTVATDDARIMDAAYKLGVPCVMTRGDHPSGTDRLHEAACLLDFAPHAVVVNIQGDEPLLEPIMLDEVLSPFFAEPAGTVQVTTLVTLIDAERAASPNQVKVVLAANGDALYFSRACIPYQRDAGNDPSAQTTPSYWGHIGLYAYTMHALARFVALPPSHLEQTEKLEQLRLLENNMSIRTVPTHHHSQGVDTPEDLERVRRHLHHEAACTPAR